MIAYYFYPSHEIGARRVTKLAQFLATQGFRVIVVSNFDGVPHRIESEIFPGIIAAPIPHPPSILVHTLLTMKRKLNGRRPEAAAPGLRPAARGKSAAIRVGGALRRAFFRLANFIDPHKRWSLHASTAALELARKYNAALVISSSPPHSTHLAALRVARKLRIPFIADFRDCWLDQHSDIDLKRASLHFRLTRAAEGLVVRNAAAIICTAPSLIDRLRMRHGLPASRLHLVRNGFDGPIAPLPMRIERTLSVLYAGELYANRDPFPFLTAVENLLGRPEVDPSRVRLTFIGRCEYFEGHSLKEWIRGRHCETVVRILPPVPVEQLTELIEQATVVLNLTQRAPLMVPAKTYDQIASGREVLLICEEDSDTALMLRGMRGTTRVDPDDQPALDEAVWGLYRRHVLEGQIMTPDPAEITQFSRETSHQAFLEVIRSVAHHDGYTDMSGSGGMGGPSGCTVARP